MSTTKDNLEIIPFADAGSFYKWLDCDHESSPGIWLRYYKKASGHPTIVWDEAVQAALCFGWIDSIANKYDDESFIQKFTTRRPRSVWSKKNCLTAERLIEAGRMQPAGLQQIQAAKADGRWEQAYDSPSTMEVPADFIAELDNHPKAKSLYATLNKSNLYAIGFRLATAKKPETRARRVEAIISLLNNGKKLH